MLLPFFDKVPTAAIVAGLWLCGAGVAADPIKLDLTQAAQVYDGHGALSAGASSRLLFDYAEPQRSDILDLLFKPNFGANLHHIKVEIGGDGQSTDGTEASHMHQRDDLSCNRGYEFWILEEARKRNPDIKTYVLSWAAPAWVGNQTGYYSQDNIDYHIKFLECTKQYEIGNIDYIGNWNERSWGPTNWTVDYRNAMDAAGFSDTKIIIPDGGDTSGIEAAMKTDATFAAAVDGLGVHYPCDHPVPSIEAEFGKKYWSSEDYSTVGDWAGAACWGRILNQNYVRMNQTSTIAWSLVWSVYSPGFSYFGNGLMYAFSPWSGYYEAGLPGSSNGAAIWTNAHSGQFSAPGWRFLSVGGGGSGMLPGGGSYVAMVSTPSNQLAEVPHITLVLEKLEGRCLRCAGQSTTAETVEFVLVGPLAIHTELQVWQTNETAHFVSLGNATAAAGTGIFSFEMQPDSIVTFSSWFNGQSKGAVSIPPPAPFPLHVSDNFDSYSIDAEARYFADNGGSFQIAEDPIAGGSNKVLKQWVMQENGVNRWGSNVNPVSLLGNASWSDVTVSVQVLIGAISPSPPPAPPPPPGQGAYLENLFSGMCLDTRGRSATPGATVDQYTCVSATNEQYAYDVGTGHFVGQNSKLCVSTANCEKGSSLCIQKCTDASAGVWDMQSVSGYNNTFVIVERASKKCLQTASKTLDASVFVDTCSTPPSAQQLWLESSTPPASPVGGDVYAGICVRSSIQGKGTCLTVNNTGGWTLSLNGEILDDGPVHIPNVYAGGANQSWTTLQLTANGSVITPVVNGHRQPAQEGSGNGMIAVVSGYHLAYFDNFEATASPPQ